MNSQISGINKWATDIRYRMANDPGRKDLDDHILCNGFLFLDEYLEDILTGARTDPIVELTKTPGRRKDTTKQVPSLPGPSTLHKSTHELSGGGSLDNTRINAVAGKGTRTSWLNKTRDIMVKHTSVIDAAIIPTKSRELPPIPALPDGNSEGMIVKRMSVIDAAIIPAKSRELPPIPALPDGNSDGMMDKLKRNLEGLGARIGKSMGRSLAGAAATAAAAEAKAAAEARLAQREAKGSDENGQGRLSVSDLIGVYDSGKGKGKESIAGTIMFTLGGTKSSASTTPPGSPTMWKSPPLVLNAASTATPVIIKSTPQQHMLSEQSFGLPDSLPDSQPSTQSTYVSSIFDDCSAWPPSSQTTVCTASQGCSQSDTQVKDTTLVTGLGISLGASKRGKAEPVKSIQLAAMAAKKQQEEAERKAARLREMDKRRAAIASKKAMQDAAEKVKQQGEQRKREREESPEKKVMRTAVKKEEELVKKRKVVKELGGSRIGKPVLNSQPQPGHGTLSKSFKQPGQPASTSQSTVKLVGTADVPKLAATKNRTALDDIRQPLQTLHAQMQARVEAQIIQSKQHEPLVPSESIELPDINSEYSNSDDEDRPRTFDPPGWAQSPDLRLALESQSHVNPDDIFGPVRPLRMEEIFPTRQSRFRARTSSANWAGTDEVTRDEEAQYAKRMGYLD